MNITTRIWYVTAFFMLLVQCVEAQLINMQAQLASNVGYANGMLQHTGTNHWIIASNHNPGSPGLITQTQVHVYTPDFQNKIWSSTLVPDSNFLIRRIIEHRGRVWLLLWKVNSVRAFGTKGAKNVELRRLNTSLVGFDTSIYVSFRDSTTMVDVEATQYGLFFYAETDTLPPPNFVRTSALHIVKLNAIYQVEKDTLLMQRGGFATLGRNDFIYPLNDNEFAVGGVSQKTWNVQGTPFRRTNTDIAVYDRNFHLKFNDVVYPNPPVNWPIADNLSRGAPLLNSSFVKSPNSNSYFYLGSHFDTTYPVVGNPPIFGRQKLFLVKLNEQFNIVQWHYFGHPGRNDISQPELSLALAPNGRLYCLSAINFGAWLDVPDSIQTLVTYSVDTNFNHPQYHYWNDENDVIGTSLKAYPSGIFILANSVGRGGEKFHVLRIEGTAWASSSSQQLWPEWGLFPNPARERVFISGEMPSKIGLHDMQGRLIHHWQNTESNELQLPSLPPGIYLLHGSNAQGQRWPVRKLVVR